MAPAWSLARGATIFGSPQPARTGLVQWTKSSVNLVMGAATRVASWGDQTTLVQDWVQGNAGNRPYVLGDDIDGKPLITFGVAGDANKSMNTAANFVDRFGADMDGAHARTIFVVIKPRFDAAFGRTGGPLWSQPSWVSYFFLDPTGIVGPANGAYAWAKALGAWGDANQFTPITGGSGGPYDNVPTLVEYSSTGRPDLGFRVNNSDVILAPTTMAGVAGGPTAAFLGDSSALSNLGGMTEVLVYDHKQSLADHAKTIAYLMAEYPSVPIVE